MARNLRAKIAESDTMVIHDVNPAVTEKFKQEVGKVTIAENVREVAETAVCPMLSRTHLNLPLQDETYCSIYD